MRLNCDLGEGSGETDAAIMPYIDQANIACGFHAGGPLAMRQTVALAVQHGVTIGAHPAYPDRENFGRRSLSMSPDEISALIHYQVAALEGIARSVGAVPEYVKPHGALYHDMMGNGEIRTAILEAMADYHLPLQLMVQATANSDAFKAQADAVGVPLLFEAFADRRYDDDGSLLSRSAPGSVLDRDEILAQVTQLLQGNAIKSIGGKSLALGADTICVHGDNPEAVSAVEAIRALIDNG